MDNNDFSLKIIAKLDKGESRKQLNKDIKKIQSELKKVKVSAKLDIQVKEDLLKQLNNLKIALTDVSVSEDAINGMVTQLNEGLSKIEIGGVKLGDSNVLNQAAQLGQEVGQKYSDSVVQALNQNDSALEKYNRNMSNKFIKSLANIKIDKSNVEAAVAEMTSLGIKISDIEQKTQKGVLLPIKISGTDGFGQIVTITRQFNVETGKLIKSLDSVSTAQKRTSADIEKTITNYTIKLENLQTKYSNVAVDYSEFNKTFDDFKNGTISVNELSLAFNRLENSVKSGTQNLKSQDKSLDPIQQAINNMRDFPATLQNIETEMNSLKDKTSLTDVSVKELSNTYEKLKAEMDSVGGKVPVTDEWTQSYRSLMSTVVELTNKIEALKKAETSDNSAVKLAEQVKAILENTDIHGETTTKIQLLRDNFTKLGLSADEVKNKMSGVDKEFSQLKETIASGDNNAIVSQFNKVNAVLSQTQNDLKVTRSEYSQLVSTQQRLSKANVIEAWNLRNSNATSEVRAANEAYIASLRDLNSQMTKMQFNEIVDGFKRAENSMRGINRLGASLKNQFSQAFQTISYTLSVAHLVRTGINYVKQMPSVVTELDTSLVDLAKTADMSSDELKDFYYASNDVAKQMGVTTNEILTQASAWSRLGYNTAESATQMAKLSSMFKLISPGMNIDDATSGLVSIMKAYDIDVDDVLDGIMSKVNIIGNNFALSNADIVAMLQDSVSAMAEGNNTLEETIALETAAFEIVQDQSVGNGFKTVALRLRGINEETQELDETLSTIKSDLYDLTGISVMQDEVTYKSTYQILKEISGVWDNLTDKAQAETLELMFGKLRSNIGASVIKNFSAAEKAMDDMANSAGNAEAEMSIMADSVSYKLNKLQETGTGIAQNLFDRDDMKNVLDFFNSLAEVLDFATDKLGLFGTIGIGTGIAASINNVGRDKMYSLFC